MVSSVAGTLTAYCSVPFSPIAYLIPPLLQQLARIAAAPDLAFQAGRAGGDPRLGCRHPPTRTDWFLPQAAPAVAANVEAYLLNGDPIMKSIILWLCGVPLVVIIGLKVFGIL